MKARGKKRNEKEKRHTQNTTQNQQRFVKQPNLKDIATK